MCCRGNRVCSTVLTLLLIVSLANSGCEKKSATKTQAGSATPQQDTPPVSEDGETDPRFIVPNGSPAEILAFAKGLSRNRPQFKNLNEGMEYTVKVNKAIVRAGDRILAMKGADDATIKDALSRKFVSTIGLIVTGNGVPPEEALEEVNRLQQDERPVVAAVARKFSVPIQALNLKILSEEQRKELEDEAIRRVASQKAAMEAIGDVTFVGDQLSRMDQNGAAADLLLRLADTIQKSTSDKKTLAIGKQIRDRSVHVRLPGSEFQLEGTLFEGGEIDWQSYRGKVVLIDFWATWCAPCVAELPNVQANYAKYHDRGFDVVGISLDRDRKQLQKFLDRESLPWKQLFDPRAEKDPRWQHPMVTKYAITQIPSAFLIDRTGKVVSVEARGEELVRQLKLLFESEN